MLFTAPIISSATIGGMSFACIGFHRVSLDHVGHAFDDRIAEPLSNGPFWPGGCQMTSARPASNLRFAAQLLVVRIGRRPRRRRRGRGAERDRDSAHRPFLTRRPAESPARCVARAAHRSCVAPSSLSGTGITPTAPSACACSFVIAHVCVLICVSPQRRCTTTRFRN
jgi:hypothetical protein